MSGERFSNLTRSARWPTASPPSSTGGSIGGRHGGALDDFPSAPSGEGDEWDRKPVPAWKQV